MAVRLVSRKGYGSGSTPANRIVLQFEGSTVGSGDTWNPVSGAHTGSGVALPAGFIPTKITSVINVTDRPMVIDGMVFNPGKWDFSEVGGLHLDTPVPSQGRNITVTNKPGGADEHYNIIVEFRL